MTTTLKLDWPAARTSAVLAVIERPDTTLTSQQLAAVWAGLELYADVSATLKLDWPASLIDALVEDLERYLQGNPRYREELTAAVTDIRGYREAVAAVKAMSKGPDDPATLKVSILLGLLSDAYRAGVSDATCASSSDPDEILTAESNADGFKVSIEATLDELGITWARP
jgi:hypothetical protein